jgi:uncharacterized protein (DUF1800 family)
MVELGEQKVLRAAYSDRQLEEVLTDFWFNHFNVDARKGRDRFMLTEYERDVIRPHVLGTFRDPRRHREVGGLFYLDNWMSADQAAPIDPQARRAGGFGRRDGQRRSGLPAMPRRPAMRRTGGKDSAKLRPRADGLHTLGVEEATQKDVTSGAR